MGQISMKILCLPRSVLGENQQADGLKKIFILISGEIGLNHLVGNPAHICSEPVQGLTKNPGGRYSEP